MGKIKFQILFIIFKTNWKDGYEVISKRIKEGTEFWEYYTKYLQKFASFSKDFGKSLQSLAKNKIYVEPESELNLFFVYNFKR